MLWTHSTENVTDSKQIQLKPKMNRELILEEKNTEQNSRDWKFEVSSCDDNLDS